MRTVDLFDNYIHGDLSEAEKRSFEAQLRTDEVFSKAFREHKDLLKALQLQSKRAVLSDKLKAIHEEEFGKHSKIVSLHREDTFAKRHGRTIAVAASTAFIAVLSTVALLSTGGYLLKKQNDVLIELNRKAQEQKVLSEAIVEGIAKNNKKVYAPANLEGSAFALNNKGYIITSFHMVNGADSIFIENNQTERMLAGLVYSDPRIDLAILKVNNSDLTANWQVPFSLKERGVDIGDRVFTLGYPRRDVVYGEGSLSSLSGFSNDTSMYQVSIPMNPGNSGGPLLDENGNIIGVIRGKISGADATGFAIKANQILSSVKGMANDSLAQELLSLNVKKGGLKGLKRSEQVKRIHPYVYNVLVYKKD